jgi:hypothetical protein
MSIEVLKFPFSVYIRMDLYLGVTLKAEVLVLSKSNRTCTQENVLQALSPHKLESCRLRIETSELSEDPTPYYRFIET